MGVINTYKLTQYDIGTWDGNIQDTSDVSYINNMCVSTSDGQLEVGDWRNWKQYDPRWKDQIITYQSIGHIGCAATSVAILLAKSGVSTSLGANLNPWTFVQAHRSHGGFYGDNILWDVTDVAPDFILEGRYFGNITPSQVASLVSQGKYVILNVKYGAHFVAVDYVQGNTIHIVDPGYNRTLIPGDYDVNSIVGYVVYRIRGR